MIYLKLIITALLIVSIGFSQFALPSFQAVSVKDNVGPRITITATDGSNAVPTGSRTNDANLSLTFTANEVATNFIVSDIVYIGGTLSSFSGSGRTYTATFSPTSNRLTSIFIPAGRYTDVKTNTSLASVPFTWTYDNSLPVIISGTTIASDNSTVTIKFNEPTYDTNSGSGALEVSDFSFALTVPMSGDPATLSSDTPSSISKATPTFSDNTVDGNLSGAASIFPIDLDQDGDMDIVVPAGVADYVVWYQNNGSQSFSMYGIDESLDGAREVFPIDLDRDGDVDVVAIGEVSDDVVWYENNGSQSFSKNTIGTIDGPRGLEVVDLDGDSDLDIVVDAYGDDIIVWYENNGSQSFSKNTIVSDAGYIPVIVDFDVDGDLDVVTSDKTSDDLLWFSNNGSQSFTENTIDGSLDGRGLAVSDLDEDGDLDIVVSSYDDDDILWYANNGSESFTKNTIDGNLDGATDVVVADLDADGDLDVGAIGYDADDVVWYANNGSESFTKYTVDASIDKPYRLKVSDIDSDGDLDIVSHGRDANDVAWYGNIDGGYVLGVSLSTTAIGLEALAVTPASSAIFDIAGNIAATSQSYNTVYLNDKRVPTMTITAVNAGSNAVSDGATTNDSYLTITFTSSESTSNFAVGDVSVSGGSLSSFSGSGTTYTATFSPSSSGATTIDVSGSTFTDAAGNNNSAASQYNWTYDGTAPTITGNSLASDNSTIAVTFSEAVYNSAGGSGSLEASDFVLTSSSGGMGGATLTSSTPSSISVSSNTYTLGIPLSGTSNGSLNIIVNPASNSIYDVVGNAASTSQSNNTATLNAANYVLNLNGSDEYVSIANNSAFQPNAFTVQAWVNLDSEANGTERYFVYRHKTWYIGMNSGGTKFIGAVRDSDNNQWQDPESSTNPDPNAGWYHVVLTFSSSVTRLYINGSQEDSDNSSGYSTNSQNTVVAIGAKNNDGSITNYFDGQVDEVAFWNEALTASEITALYNSGSGLDAGSNSGNYTSSGNLVSYHQMQQNLNDTEESHNGTGSGIASSNYVNTSFE